MKKSKILNLIFNVLFKGINGAVTDKRIFSDIQELPEGMVIQLGVFGNGNYVTVKHIGSAFYNIPETSKPDLKIEFKSISSAKAVAFGKQSVSQSFANHDILVYGDISKAVALTRIINLVEYYLFPRFITKKLMDKTKKQFCSLKLYCYILFAKRKILK